LCCAISHSKRIRMPSFTRQICGAHRSAMYENRFINMLHLLRCACCNCPAMRANVYGQFGWRHMLCVLFVCVSVYVCVLVCVYRFVRSSRMQLAAPSSRSVNIFPLPLALLFSLPLSPSHTRAHTHTHMRTHAHTYAHTHTNTHTHIRTHQHKHTHHPPSNTVEFAHIQTHSQIHT